MNVNFQSCYSDQNNSAIMPTKYFIQNKRKSFDQEFFADCTQNDQKRQCLGLLNYDRSEWKQKEPVTKLDATHDMMEENMEEVEVTNGCGIMQLENSNCSISNINGNNNSSSSFLLHSHQHQETAFTDFTSCDDNKFVSQNSDFKPTEAVSSPPSSTPSYYQKLNTTLGPADRFCVGGAFGYQLGLNRSYCKPSWDAIADMRTYVSDYY
ncbi:putative uncharacterized protein DDB_G0291608 isoform X1 [Argonauta hians]